MQKVKSKTENKTMEEKKRCFISLGMPKEVIEEIKGMQERIRKQNLFNGKFIEEENLHLTLKFLGEVDDETIEKVKERLRGIDMERLKCRLGKIGVFSKTFVRIIWVKLIGADGLQEAVDEKLEGLFEKERRFMSHITIARVKNVGDRKRLIDYVEKMNPKKIEFEVKGFDLMKSELYENGPIYEVLERYELR